MATLRVAGRRRSGGARARRGATLVTLGCAVALGPAAAGSSAASFPARGVGPATDGRDVVSVLAPDRSSVSVVDLRTSAVVTTPVPTAAAGRTLRASTLGLIDGRPLLLVQDATEPGPGAGAPPERYALVESGMFRWLCGQPADPIAGPVSLCPSVGAADGSFRGFTSIAAGRSWIRMAYVGPHGRGSAVRWGIRPDGSFWWRVPTARQRRAIAGGGHLDLDRAAPRPEAPFGLRVRRSAASSSRAAVYVVRRSGDARNARLRLSGDPERVRSLQIGSRGLCLVRGGRLVVLDRASRRLWRRDVPAFSGRDDASAVCAGSTVVTAAGGVLDWSLRWPSAGRADGWTSAGTLRPGGTLTVPAG